MAEYVFLSVICAECHNVECHLCCVSFLLTVENFSCMVSVIVLSAIMLSVIMLSAIMLSVIMLSAIMLSVIMLNVIILSVSFGHSLMLTVTYTECHFAKSKCHYAQCHLSSLSLC